MLLSAEMADRGRCPRRDRSASIALLLTIRQHPGNTQRIDFAGRVEPAVEGRADAPLQKDRAQLRASAGAVLQAVQRFPASVRSPHARPVNLQELA